jgi:hypothetical protein
MWTRSPAGMTLFAQNGFIQWDLMLAVGALVAVVALGSWAIYTAKQWRDNLAQDAPLSRDEQLARYQQMVDDGRLDPEEFAQIKAQLENPAPATQLPRPLDQPPDTSFREP